MKAEWVPVPDSSNITRFKYEEDNRLLTIEFHGGRVYDYPGVPKTVANRFASASSKGSFFNENIKDNYTGRRVKS